MPPDPPDEIVGRVERIVGELEAYAPGVHRLAEPARLLDAALPPGLAGVYRAFDGGELFHESLELFRSSRIQQREGMLLVGEVSGDELLVDPKSGEVFRIERDTGERLEEGTSFDRWLHGYVDAEAVIYDRLGEFREGVFDETGELTEGAVIRRERAAIRRDRKAPAPRWRLAGALARTGELEAARRELEEVVALRPGFAWAWFDLARLSEQSGALAPARDEVEEAARADEAYEYAGFFWAHAARLAAKEGDEAARAEAAARALEADPELLRMQLRGARELLEEGAREAALELAELCAALAPRDLEALELLRRLRDGSKDPGGAPVGGSS